MYLLLKEVLGHEFVVSDSMVSMPESARLLRMRATLGFDMKELKLKLEVVSYVEELVGVGVKGVS